MVLEASSAELALVAMILVIVLIAPKVPRLGERIGAFFGSRQASPSGISESGRPPEGKSRGPEGRSG